MPHANGYRARTRHMFSHGFRKGGVTNLTNYLTTYKVGDYVDIKANPTIHKGMPFKYYHGRTGIVFNVTKRALGVRVNKEVNGRMIKKRVNVRVEHVKPSKCRQEVIRRTKENEAKKVEARKTGGASSCLSVRTLCADVYLLYVLTFNLTLSYILCIYFGTCS